MKKNVIEGWDYSMYIFKAIYLTINKEHPCVYLLDNEEERMIETDDYISNMTEDIKLSKGLKIADEWELEMEEIVTAVIEQDLSNIILARSW